MFATHMGPRQLDLVAQEIGQRRSWFNLGIVRPAIDDEAHENLGSPICFD
jgi:hypothetical protein